MWQAILIARPFKGVFSESFRRYIYLRFAQSRIKKRSGEIWLSLLAENDALLKEVQQKVLKKTKKIGLRKKVCSFEWYLVLNQKYTKSFGGKNLALCNRFVPSKFEAYVWFLTRLCSKVQIFFFLATLHSQKRVKEIHIPISFQAPFKSAMLF